MDRNLWWGVRKAVGSLSLSARRAWIEINSPTLCWIPKTVALRKESVDRNFYTMQIVIIVVVALRKESVDRNIDTQNLCVSIMSLSARRAWIEIIDDLEPSRTRKCRSPQGERG